MFLSVKENIICLFRVFGHSPEWLELVVLDDETFVIEIIEIADDVIRVIIEFSSPFSEHFRIDDRLNGLECLFPTLKDKQLRAFDIAFDKVWCNAKSLDHFIESLDVGLDLCNALDGY